MRIYLRTTPNDVIVPFDYQQKIVGTIHKWLGNNEIHDKISLYSFSWLLGGNMIVDIGGGTTDIAVISLGGSVVSESLKVAGDKFDEAIVKYIKKRHNVMIGERTAEELKINIGCVYPKIQDMDMDIRGRDLITGLPKTITVHSSEMLEALIEPAMMIVDSVHSVLEKTPPELAADISDKGIYMTGGGCLVDGLDKLLQEKTGINVMIAQDAVSCVALGTGKALDNLDALDSKKR